MYCDTGVEIPTVAAFVHRTLRDVVRESRKGGLPIRVRVARPLLQDSFFVKVIGRGYPTPTNKFRWCTNRLRINPVRRVLQRADCQQGTVLLGTRKGESESRDRTLARHKGAKAFYYRQSGNAGVNIFAPIEDFSTSEVWNTLFGLRDPIAMDTDKLARMYKDAGAECPIVRDPAGTPCGAGRFGCWTCTVVRKDRAVSSMVAEGHLTLKPLLEFRDWLASVRDIRSYRCRWRRNGTRGWGPFTLSARKEILERLQKVQQVVPWKLLDTAELEEIRRLWRVDLRSATYRE